MHRISKPVTELYHFKFQVELTGYRWNAQDVPYSTPALPPNTLHPKHVREELTSDTNGHVFTSTVLLRNPKG